MTRVKNAVEGRKETRRRLEKMDEREGEKKNGRTEEESRKEGTIWWELRVKEGTKEWEVEGKSERGSETSTEIWKKE